MTDVAKLIADYGVLLIIAAVFIWDKIANAKTVENILIELKNTSHMQLKTLDSLKTTVENTTTALNIIQNTLANQNTILIAHDKRSEFMNTDIKKILEHVRSTTQIIDNINEQNVSVYKEVSHGTI